MVGHTSLVSGLIADGQLVTLSDHRVTAPNQFYLLTRAGLPLPPIVAAFVDWLLLEAGSPREGDGALHEI